MITILCAGSRGDIQPYIALAQQLSKLGLDNRIAAGRAFGEFIRGYGVEHYSIDVDFQSVGMDAKTIQEAQSADTVFKMFASFRKLRDYAADMMAKYHDACAGSSAVVYHPGVAVGYFAAQQLGIPGILASPFPLHHTARRPSVILYGRVKPNFAINRLSHWLLQSMLWMASKSTLKSFWKTTYGRLPEAFGKPFELHQDHRQPAIISCSDQVFARPEDWHPQVRQHGYWFVEESQKYHPPTSLSEFLATGERPLYFGFGSMFNAANSERIGRLIVDALALVRRRGVLSGMPGLSSLPSTVTTIESVPHTWLFPRMAAVCHHGGAGTTAAGFRAGVPSIIVPFALDQFAWSHRGYELGIASKPLPFKKLTVDRLAAAIRVALQPDLGARAAQVGSAIAAEHGARDCAQVIAAAVGPQ